MNEPTTARELATALTEATRYAAQVPYGEERRYRDITVRVELWPLSGGGVNIVGIHTPGRGIRRDYNRLYEWNELLEAYFPLDVLKLGIDSVRAALVRPS